MKTRLEGNWRQTSLYPDFAPSVAKYADNGRPRTLQELTAYFRQYMRRAPIDYLRHRIQYPLHELFRLISKRIQNYTNSCEKPGGLLSAGFRRAGKKFYVYAAV